MQPDRLIALAGVPAADLRVLRAQIAAALFEADKPAFAKMAALSKALPGPIAAKITEHAIAPLLAARTAELVEPHRAVDMVARMSDDYLADVSAALDASRAPELIARIPAHRVATIGAELARRQQWVVIGGFVAQISPAAMAAAVQIFDGGQLLRIGFVLDDKARVDDVVRLVTDAQIDEMFVAAAAHALWGELDDVLAHLSTRRAARMRAGFARAPAEVVAATTAAARSGALSRAGRRALTA
ncbi:MAG: hypothetical protein ABR604_08785 [Jatrophihabitantaceae bacterium]